MEGIIVDGCKYVALEKLENLVLVEAYQTRTPALQAVSKTWTENANRFLKLSKLPANMFRKGLFSQMNTVRLTESNRQLFESWMQVNEETRTRMLKEFQEFAEALQQHEDQIGPDMVGGYDAVERACDLHYGEEARALMTSQIVGMWTAFEALAGDLWEAALDAHPAGLAELAGTRNRITKMAKTRLEKSERTKESSEVEGQAIRLQDLHKLAQGNYDFSGAMGRLLKGNCKFTTLTGIREAYARAFNEHAESIDKALSNQALDALLLVRNLIVHKAGVADQLYVDGSNTVSQAPKLSIGQSLEVDGTMVNELVSQAFDCSRQPLTAVDSYLART
jgi:hypothetical protein